MINYGDQLIGVVRKGGARQWLPASPDAFVWLRLYQLDRGTPGDGQPVWLTLREPHRPLTYDALRAVIARVNRLLGANWTLHDLRHTFAIRALDGGVPMHEVQDLLGHASLDKNNWLGEVEGLKVSLAGAEEKLEEMERLTADDSPVLLGLPTTKRH